MIHNVIEPRCSACPRSTHVCVKALGEHAPATQDSIAIEAARANLRANWATYDRQIGQNAGGIGYAPARTAHRNQGRRSPQRRSAP